MHEQKKACRRSCLVLPKFEGIRPREYPSIRFPCSFNLCHILSHKVVMSSTPISARAMRPRSTCTWESPIALELGSQLTRRVVPWPLLILYHVWCCPVSYSHAFPIYLFLQSVVIGVVIGFWCFRLRRTVGWRDVVLGGYEVVSFLGGGKD